MKMHLVWWTLIKVTVHKIEEGISGANCDDYVDDYKDDGHHWCPTRFRLHQSVTARQQNYIYQ